MPDLNFEVRGVDAAERGLTPLLIFSLKITNNTPADKIQSIMLHAQIQIQSPQRSYSVPEKDKLRELFGKPEDWGQTLRTKLWTHANTVVASFGDHTEATLPVPCTFDLNVAAAKYFYALEEGDVPLLFLFSGTIFYSGANGQLQIERISWEKEAEYRMPIAVWRQLMDRHYPNSAWISLERDMFDRLYEFKRKRGFATWDQAMEQLLAQSNGQQQ